MRTIIGLMLLAVAGFFWYVSTFTFRDRKALIQHIANHEGIGKQKERAELFLEQDRHELSVIIGAIFAVIGAAFLIFPQ